MKIYIVTLMPDLVRSALEFRMVARQVFDVVCSNIRSWMGRHSKIISKSSLLLKTVLAAAMVDSNASALFQRYVRLCKTRITHCRPPNDVEDRYVEKSDQVLEDTDCEFCILEKTNLHNQ